MGRAPLRPVPGRPSGPVSDAAAVALVASALPSLSERDRVALALVALVATPRPQVALRLGTDEPQLSECLARARKELRRTLAPLPGSGWCERAERLISDRIDGALVERDEPRLDVHLRNCPRCVEHERRLVAATDALVATAAPAPSPPELVPPAAGAEETALSLATPAASEPSDVIAEAQPAGLPARLILVQLASIVGWSALVAFGVLLALASAVLVANALGVQL